MGPHAFGELSVPKKLLYFPNIKSYQPPQTVITGETRIAYIKYFQCVSYYFHPYKAHKIFEQSKCIHFLWSFFFFFLKCTFEQKLQHQAFLASLSTKNILAIRNKNDKTSLMNMISRCPVCLNFVNSCPVFSINTINICVIPVHLNNQRA